MEGSAHTFRRAPFVLGLLSACVRCPSCSILLMPGVALSERSASCAIQKKSVTYTGCGLFHYRICRRDLHDTVDVNSEGDVNLGHSFRRWQHRQRDMPQPVVLTGNFPLPYDTN